MENAFTYVGDELVLFQHAKNWKSYFSKAIKPFIRGDVLEVGAGIGATTILLNDGRANSWLLLEPDKDLSRLLEEKNEAKQLPGNCKVQTGTIDDLQTSFDTIIYIDVLEHILEDREELEKTVSRLKKGANLVVLSPAFQSLYNPFDKAIGHYRRYTKRSLQEISPAALELIKSKYFDSTGFFAAWMNKKLLRKKYPTQRQVLFWDRWMIPVSRVTDKLVFHSFGKSIIAIWKKA